MDAPEIETPALAGESAGPAVPPEAAAMLERQPFRGYELRSVLAHDEQGVVFKGHDQTMDRAVAVKVMTPYPGREGVVEEFFSLAGSIAQLRCPGAARGLDAGRGDGRFFMVYEYLAAERLRERIERRVSGRLTEKESLALVGELARVLQSLFELGHPHGNFHPGNIILGEGGSACLAGIGFAWSLAYRDDEAACRARPNYLPPERIANELGIDIRGDLYSLGAVWFAMLAGRPVFVAETPDDVLRMHLEVKPPSVREFDPKISAATATLINWLLEKDRDRRPRTPKEFLRKLAAHPLLAAEPEPDSEAEEAEEADQSEEPHQAEPNGKSEENSQFTMHNSQLLGNETMNNDHASSNGGAVERES
ncbi:MAG: serine/threonine protein kinase [Planctomycetaceae bacterium]|nr:serine/threonine protein kinase [Planctomycetaceae bacterium]